MHIPIFLVFYSTTFTILLLALIALLLVSPADAIYQSLRNQQPANVIIIAGAYLLTLLVSGFFYATRLYATRTHLAALPRSARIPHTLAGGAVRKTVQLGLARAAAIAYAAHPRDLIAEREANAGHPPPPPPELLVPGSGPAPEVIRTALKPAFGVIHHSGWTAPSTADLPGVQFSPVVEELPHLLEAKAVSMAPPEPAAAAAAAASYQSTSAKQEDTGLPASPFPDPVVVSALQRPSSMDVRAYVGYLGSLGTITDIRVASNFVKQYEYARFSGRVLDEDAFRQLMSTFASLLRNLTPPDMELLRDASRSDARSTVSSRFGPSGPPSMHSQPSIQDMRLERPAVPKRGHTTGSAAHILDRMMAQDSYLPNPHSINLPAPLSNPLPESTTISGRSMDPPIDSALLPTTSTPHQTPFFTPYRTSVSSNDGDRSADTSDADFSDGSMRNRSTGAPTGGFDSGPHSRLSRRRTLTRHSTHSSSAKRRTIRGLGLEMTRAHDSSPSRSTEEDAYLSFDSEGSEDTQDDGSVIRRVVTAREMSRESISDAGSVVVRPEDHGVGGLLPVPIAVAGNSTHDATEVAEMRMVDPS